MMNCMGFATIIKISKGLTMQKNVLLTLSILQSRKTFSAVYPLTK